MARFVSGEVVVVPIPFTDLSSAKVRPALVLASLTRGDLILCQITSQAAGHPEAVPLLPADFKAGGGLARASFALPQGGHGQRVLRATGCGKAPGSQAGPNPGERLRGHPAKMN
jgi:hypothetical protein